MPYAPLDAWSAIWMCGKFRLHVILNSIIKWRAKLILQAIQNWLELLRRLYCHDFDIYVVANMYTKIYA